MTIGPAPGPPREPLICVLVKIGHLLEQQMNRELAHENLGANQYLALAYVARHPKISRAELARTSGHPAGSWDRGVAVGRCGPAEPDPAPARTPDRALADRGRRPRGHASRSRCERA